MRAGIEIPRDDCEWRAGDEGNMANRCDGDQIAVGACGGGFNNDCPGSADIQGESKKSVISKQMAITPLKSIRKGKSWCVAENSA